MVKTKKDFASFIYLDYCMNVKSTRAKRFGGLFLETCHSKLSQLNQSLK